MDARSQAQSQFARHIQSNPYPGRGIVVGRSDQGEFLLVYWIMGRSANSQNRRFVAEGGSLRTEPVDASKVRDPSLIIYEAMAELPGLQIVTNGDQTSTLVDALSSGGTLELALETREREPDAPNYTPRISAVLDTRSEQPKIALAVLKANPFDPADTDRFYYRPSLPQPGFGVALTTYMGDGDPLPSFSGEPLLLPCTGDAAQVLRHYWKALHPDNRVALAVKRVSSTGETRQLLIENRFA